MQSNSSNHNSNNTPGASDEPASAALSATPAVTNSRVLPAKCPLEDQTFLEFRRKVRDSELLSSSIVRLLDVLHFSGRLMVVVQNGHVLKSGYEEGYFRRRNELPLLS